METTFALDPIQQLVAGLLTGGVFALLVSYLGGVAGLWNLIDISDNMSRATRQLAEIENGPIAGVYAVVFLILSAFAVVMAYIYDISTTIEFTEHLRAQGQTYVGDIAIAAHVLSAVTIIPVLMEMFGARLARGRNGIAIIAGAVIAFSVLDLYTDLPRVQDFMSRHEGFYRAATNGGWDYLLNIIYQTCYNVVFGFWWGLASYGFEAAAVVFLWSAIGCAIKVVFAPKGTRGVGRRMRTAAVGGMDDDE